VLTGNRQFLSVGANLLTDQAHTSYTWNQVRILLPKGIPIMGLKERAAARRAKMVAHRAANFEEAEAWDLDFWQRQSPEQRLSAFVAIRRDVDKVMKGRLSNEQAARKGR
jgi:hypothetical protein